MVDSVEKEKMKGVDSRSVNQFNDNRRSRLEGQLKRRRLAVSPRRKSDELRRRGESKRKKSARGNAKRTSGWRESVWKEKNASGSRLRRSRRARRTSSAP